MSYDYGTKDEPGIVTDLTSTVGTPQFGEAPNNVVLIGQANLDEGSANEAEVYEVASASSAVSWFGPQDSSQLTAGIVDAIAEGANPVYAVPAASESQTQAFSSETDTIVSVGLLDLVSETPTVENVDTATELTVNVTYNDLSNETVASDEALFNAASGDVLLPQAPDTTTSGYEITGQVLDYEAAIDAARDAMAEEIDYLAPLTENQSVVDYANTTVGEMESRHNFAMLLAGASPSVSLDPNQFSNNYDDSRTQLIYPSRFEDGTSAVASFAGLRASLGLTQTPINRRFQVNDELIETTSVTDRGNLIDEDVTPLANESRGARVADDQTTVANDNTDERNLEYGFNRIAADYIIETTRENEQPFIGRLNDDGVRQTLEALVNQQLSELQQSRAVIDYSVNITSNGQTEAVVQMELDLVEPLRHIENNVVIEA